MLATVGRALLLAAALVLLACGAAWGFLQTEAGRRELAQRVARALDEALLGSVRIDAVEDVSWLHATVLGFEVREPRGSTVLRVERATLGFDAVALLRGELEVPWARAERGRVVIAVQPNGKTGLEAAFASASTEPEPPEGEDDGLVMTFSNIQTSGLQVVLQPSADETFVIRNVGGMVRIKRPRGEGVHVQLERIHGRAVKPQLLGNEIELRRVDGWVQGNALQILELAFWTQLEDHAGRIDGQLSLFSRKREPLKVRLRPHGGAVADMSAALVQLQALMSKDADIEVSDGT